VSVQQQIATDRLLIEPLTLTDHQFIYELVNTKEWKQFIGERNINSLEDAKSYIQKILDNPDISYWIVRLPVNGFGIGVITFIKRIYLEFHDIGFAFLAEHGKKGYAHEAVTAVLNYLLPKYESPKVFATTVPENINSIKLLEKLGMQFKKEILVDESKLHVYSVASDHLRINEVVRTFFGVFTNVSGKQPNWGQLKQLCIPEIILINKKDVSQEVYNLETFSAPRKKILSDGTLIDFMEFEISGQTQIQSNIAQRHSRYQKSGVLAETPFVELGNKFFHLIKTQQGWKITSVIWEDDRS
jgi:RimJ/RimL family protein N-acetyltransferase